MAALCSIAIGITTHKTLPINFSKVSEACLLKVMRPLRIVTAPVLGITLSGLQPIMVAFVPGCIGTVEDVMSITAVVVKVWIVAERPSPTPRTIERPIDWAAHHHDSTLSLSDGAG